jgi:hypothetical protein
MQIEPTPAATRIILEFDAHRFPMSIGDSSVVAEFAKDRIDRPMGGDDTKGVMIEGGLVIAFLWEGSQMAVVGREKLDHDLARMTLSKSRAIRFTEDVRRACDEAQGFFDRDAA